MLLTEQYLTHRHYVTRHNISLMQLHEFNYKLFQHLLPEGFSEHTDFQSITENKPALHLKVRERFKFTTELSMCMVFDDAVSDALVIRIYHDAQLVELIYSNEFEKQYRLMGGKVDMKNQASLRYSQNCFLNKWLIYLIQNGFDTKNWKTKNTK